MNTKTFKLLAIQLQAAPPPCAAAPHAVLCHERPLCTPASTPAGSVGERSTGGGAHVR